MKRLAAKVDEYQKEGQTKGKYIELGVLNTANDGGEYILLDPTVNLAGVLVKQNAMNAQHGKPAKTSIMVSVFDGQQQGQQPGGFQQPQQQTPKPHPNQTGGMPPQGTQGYGASGPQAPQQGGLVDDGSGIPF